MSKPILAAAIILTGCVSFVSAAVAQAARPAPDQEKTCKAVLSKQKGQIDRLQAANDEAGIKALFAKGGCTNLTVDRSAAPPPSNTKARKRWHWELVCSGGGGTGRWTPQVVWG